LPPVTSNHESPATRHAEGPRDPRLVRASTTLEARDAERVDVRAALDPTHRRPILSATAARGAAPQEGVETQIPGSVDIAVAATKLLRLLAPHEAHATLARDSLEADVVQTFVSGSTRTRRPPISATLSASRRMRLPPRSKRSLRPLRSSRSTRSGFAARTVDEGLRLPADRLVARLREAHDLPGVLDRERVDLGERRSAAHGPAHVARSGQETSSR